ncbi:MAG TPA: bifunctional glycosyltransferase/class I SAM-dependent methyltransferase [Bryobacteraceae bacterium]|jgi:2-polyprenyl-3-methyl-5-hydroxy-6-metoxy-1,4-benzoquinol methylase|nr:bifunctional glycosyltransferase/class I SAM-dependent methyltransferase [Bryobacteraceae bacterium]
MPPKPRVLIFVVAYNAEKTVAAVVHRIPCSLLDSYRVDILIIDDASADATFEQSHLLSSQGSPFPVYALYNPVNQGYGGNQKIGYHYALRQGYDFVALLHGDGQYAPECLPALLEPMRRGEAAAVFGSRMLPPSGALRGGMPVYKFLGNRILTWLENRLLRTSFSEFHSGYRIYSTHALASIPFDRNSNDFHFDTEIIIQLLVARHRILELPIPTYYGDEISHVNGLSYAWHVVGAAIKARLQHAGIVYDRKFDCAPPGVSPYLPKLSYHSPHFLALKKVHEGSRVLDIGCASGYLAHALSVEKGCRVDGIDSMDAQAKGLAAFYKHDLNDGLPRIPYEHYDVVLLLDVVEHLAHPEAFLDELRRVFSLNPKAEVMISTANIGFFIPRLALMLGQFNYGKRGILDLTHTRLFTFSSFRRTLMQAGFEILEMQGIPGPFPLALGDNFFSRMLVQINRFLIRISRGLFSYQIFSRIRPLPSLDSLLNAAEYQSRKRGAALSGGRSDTHG